MMKPRPPDQGCELLGTVGVYIILTTQVLSIRTVLPWNNCILHLDCKMEVASSKKECENMVGMEDMNIYNGFLTFQSRLLEQLRFTLVILQSARYQPDCLDTTVTKASVYGTF